MTVRGRKIHTTEMNARIRVWALFIAWNFYHVAKLWQFYPEFFFYAMVKLIVNLNVVPTVVLRFYQSWVLCNKALVSTQESWLIALY